MSVSIHCENVVKKYGEVTVIPGLSLSVREGEFFTLLGPSGCGKTTLLRMIAGFNSIEGGEIKFNDKVINDLPPGKRNIGMVFQNYAVFPHMNVRKNVAFGLTTRKVPKEEIDKRVDKILKTVQIDQYQDRMPDRLSGGQQQRVALARAIVIEPDVLLMDEPLSNLDAKLRVEMRNVIRDIQKSINITTVYVTHDQEEAMAVSDRIAIMSAGVIQQVGAPRDIYKRPFNAFVANFIGHSTFLNGTVKSVEGKPELVIDNYHVSLEGAPLYIPEGSGETKVRVAVRPEEFYLSTDDEGLPGTVTSSILLGLYTDNFIKLADGSHVQFIDLQEGGRDFKTGDKIRLKVYPKRINLFDEKGERSYSIPAGEMGAS
jgi:iron(III) transport system ATP-binding protein